MHLYTGSVSNLFERPLTWFSYVAGDDIRKACLGGGREYFRVVYKTIYEKQIRTYEMQGVDGGARYTARPRNESGQMLRFQFSNLLGPWELSSANVTLTDSQPVVIVDAFSRNAAAAPDPAGRQVAGNEFYCIVSACNAGQFRVWLFEQDKTDLSALTFVPELRRFDNTGIAFREVKPLGGV